MRLLCLDLLRYGHLSDLALRFPEATGLHVVLGPNEAGKSTALAAIGDALFGFPHLTRFAFLHETSQLRIGFEVMARDGSRAGFIRLKRRKDALLDAAGAPVAETALQRFLGGAGRDVFERAFGLDAAALRAGAKSLIEGGGAAGEAMVAGMGLPHLHRALARLEKQADELHGTRHKARRLPMAVDAFQQAQRGLEQAAVKPAEWTAAQDHLAAIAAEGERIAAERAALKTEELRLRRARAVRQPLAELDRLRAALDAVADAPALPEEAAATLARLSAALARAREDAAREAGEAARVEDQLAQLSRDPAMLALQDAVDALAPLRERALGAAEDLPRVRQEAAAQRERIAAAAARLGLEVPPEAVRAALPQERQRLAAQRLIRGRTALLTRLADAESRLRDALRRRARAAAALAEAEAPAPAAALRRAIEEARAEGRLDPEIEKAARELVEAEARAGHALAALDLWSGDAAALAACRLPLEAACEEAARRLDEAAAMLEAARSAAATQAAEAATLEAELERLSAAGTVPTPEVIARARALRDDAWQAIRRRLAGDTLAGHADPAGFEALRDEADRLADARAEEAERVNDYATRAERLAALRAARPATEAALAEAEAGMAAARQAWHALWAPSGLAPLSPPAMREWRAARERVLDLATRAGDLRIRRDDLLARREAARARLAAELPAPHPPGLAPLLAAAEAACALRDAAAEAHRRLRDAAGKAAEEAEEAQARRDEAAARLAEEGDAWRDALALLRLPGMAGPEEVEAALAAWGSVAEAAAAWQAAEVRIAAMEATLADLAREATSLAARLGEVQREEAAPATASRLARRLAEARAAEIKAEELARQVETRHRALAAAGQALQAAEAELSRLHAAAGTADLPALEEAVRRDATRRALRAAIAAEEARLREQGEGIAEAALRAEVAAADPDTAAARLQEIEARQAELDESRTRLGEARQQALARIAELEKGRDAAGLAQDARQALADAQAAAERYARLHAARTLLKAGIERLRQSQQGPMLQAATRHFALLTGGRYARLVVEEDDGGAPLLRAVRDDGTACPMDQLSEGARDQLFLALRVAALELQAAEAEPLPFIADDLLASFDEARAEAALRLLAGLGQRVQVILFTHHAHVASLAAGVPGAAVIRLAEEAGPRAALPAA